MEPSIKNAEIPILLIYNLDRDHWGSFEIQYTLDKIDLLSKGLTDLGHPLTVIPVYDSRLEEKIKPFSPDDFVLFNLCEELTGVPHSAGLVGQIIEQLGFIHTGASARILTFCQDKINSKIRVAENKIPTPAWFVFTSTEDDGWNRFPAIVKPSLEHCSVGIEPSAVVNNHQELIQRVDYVLGTFKQPALVEDFIDGREFRTSVIGNGKAARLLPPFEMDYSYFNQMSERLLSYDSKMDPDSTYFKKIKLIGNPLLSAEEYSLLETLALKTFHLFECRDYAGFDFRLKDGIFYLLDVNPDPEFSQNTSMTLGAAKEGLSFVQLASFVVREAALRHPRLQLNS